MKFTFKKIASVLASAVMLSSTVALAAAANYPAPFVENGVANVAVVYGGADADPADLVAAQLIAANLQSKVAVSSEAVTASAATGGDSIKLEKANDKFDLGESMSGFFGGSIDVEQLSTVLADGVYSNDANNEYDFEQTIDVGTGLTLSFFADNDYKDKTPTIGFALLDNNHILNYTLEFTPDDAQCGDFGLSTTTADDCETTYITMLGRTYYVVKTENVAGNGVQITLLDAANSATVTEGESSTLTVGGQSYEVSIGFVDEDETILTVNGVDTNKLKEGDVFKVGTDLYVGVKSVLYNSKESGISKVEISLGSGKIVMENGQEVEINNEAISEDTNSKIKAYITNTSSDIQKIVLQWDLDEDAFIAPGSELILPGFETIKFSMGGFVEPSKEMTLVENNGDEAVSVSTEIKDGDVELGILYQNSSESGFDGIGMDSDEKLVTIRDPSAGITMNLSNDDTYFVASWIDDEDSESYVFEVTDITGASNENTTKFKNVASSGTFDLGVGDDKDIGEINIKVISARQDTDVAVINVTKSGSSGTVSGDKLFSKAGLKIQLPVSSGTLTGDGILNFTSADPTSFTMNFTEEDEDSKINVGKSFTFPITPSVDGPSVGSPTGVTEKDDQSNNDIKIGYVTSALATKTVRDTGNDPTTLDIEYHGSESYADVYLSEVSATISGGAVGAVIVPITDSEAASVTSNLIVVGGSCINTVAAGLLGSAAPLCGEDFTAKTGVGAGQFLIQTFERSGGKVATLVAGYNVGDTTNAATYFRTQAVDTTAGKKYKGTSATAATLVTV